MLAESAEKVETLGDEWFEQVPLGNGWFWILRPDVGDPGLPAFGLTDETAKIDLNTIDYERLRLVEGMTDDLAASIIDWRDEDEEPTDGIGAEGQVYLSRDPGHAAKNTAYESVEELLFVEGMDRQLLYGDGTAPPLGQIGGITSGDRPFENQAYRARGFYDLFTIWSMEPMTSWEEDEDRINVKDDGSRQALAELFVEVFGESRGNELAGRIPPGQAVVDIFDFASRLQMDPLELAQIEDRITVADNQTITMTGQGGQVVIQVTSGPPRGKINVNWAPREALLTLPNLEESDVDALIARRATEIYNDPHSIAWVMEVLESKAIGLGRFITGRGAVYSADIVALSGNGRAFRRVRIVVDTSPESGPRIVYRRDLTDLGWPMDPELLSSLRNGGQSQQMMGTGRFR
jgi:DNA uptake protein ComE-like DNA-binding protein